MKTYAENSSDRSRFFATMENDFDKTKKFTWSILFMFCIFPDYHKNLTTFSPTTIELL